MEQQESATEEVEHHQFWCKKFKCKTEKTSNFDNKQVGMTSGGRISVGLNVFLILCPLLLIIEFLKFLKFKFTFYIGSVGRSLNNYNFNNFTI